MAIAVNEITTAKIGNNIALTITKPANVANGDVLVAFLSNTDNHVITQPADWIEVDLTTTTLGSDMTTHIWYKVISDAGGEPANYTWTAGAAEDWAGGIIRLSGVDTSTPIDVANSIATGENYDDTSDVCPTITTVTDNALFFAFLGLTHAASGAHAGVTGMTNAINVEQFPDFSFGINVYVDYAIKTPAGATGNKLYDLDTYDVAAEWHTYQCAFRPAEVPVGNAGIMTTNTGYWGPTF